MANPQGQKKLTTLSRRCAKLLMARRPAFLLMEHSDKVVWHNYAALLVTPELAQQDALTSKALAKLAKQSISAQGNQVNQSLTFIPQGRSTPTQLRLQYNGQPVHLSCVCTPYMHDEMQSRLLLCIAEAPHPLVPKHMDRRVELFAELNTPDLMQFVYTKRRGRILHANMSKTGQKQLRDIIKASDEKEMGKDHILFHKANQIKPVSMGDKKADLLRYAIDFKSDKSRMKNRFLWFQDQMHTSSSAGKKSKDFKKFTSEMAKKSIKRSNPTSPMPPASVQEPTQEPVQAMKRTRPEENGKSIKNLHELVQRLANESRQTAISTPKPVLQDTEERNPLLPQGQNADELNASPDVQTDTQSSAIEKAGLLMLDDEFAPDEAQILAQIAQFEERMRREEEQHGTDTSEDAAIEEDGTSEKDLSVDEDIEETLDENLEETSLLGDDFDDDLDVFEADSEGTKDEDLSNQFSTQKPAIEPNPTFEKLSNLLRDRLGRDNEPLKPDDIQFEEPAKKNSTDTANIVQFRSASQASDIDSSAVYDKVAPSGDDISILNRLPLALMVYRDDQILFANRQFVELVDFPSLDALRRLKASQLWPTAPAQPLDEPAMKLVSFDGAHIPVHARLQTVFWHQSQALLLTVEKKDGDTATAGETLQPVDLCKAADLFGTAIAVIDEEAVIKHTNHNAQILLHQSETVLAKQSLHLMLDAKSLEQFQHYFQSLKQHEEPTQSPRFAAKIFMPSGAEREVFLTIGAASSDTDKEKFYFVRIEDSTNQQIWTKGAEALEKQSFDRSARHADMLSHLSHDIRTPLTTIIGFAQLLHQDSPRLQPVQEQKVNAILDAGDELNATLQHMVQLHELESQTEAQETTLIDISQMLHQTAATHRPEANNAHIVLRTNFATDLGLFEGIEDNITQILDSLLATAIKRSPVGHSVILSALMDEDGITINIKEEAPFEGPDANAQLNGKKSGNRLGSPNYKTAFGFAIAKATAEANGCTLTINPAAGIGTLYSLMLPQNRLHEMQVAEKTDA